MRRVEKFPLKKYFYTNLNPEAEAFIQISFYAYSVIVGRLMDSYLAPQVC